MPARDTRKFYSRAPTQWLAPPKKLDPSLYDPLEIRERANANLRERFGYRRPWLHAPLQGPCVDGGTLDQDRR